MQTKKNWWVRIYFWGKKQKTEVRFFIYILVIKKRLLYFYIDYSWKINKFFKNLWMIMMFSLWKRWLKCQLNVIDVKQCCFLVIDNWLLVIDNWLLVSDNLIIDIFDWHCSQLFKHSNCSPNLVNFSGDKEIL